MNAPVTWLRRWQWAALCMVIAMHLAGATVTATAACRAPDEHTNPPPSPRELVVLDRKGDDKQLYSTSVALLVGESKYLGGANGFTPLSSVRREMATLRKVLEAHGFEVYVYYDLDSSNLKSTLECFFTSQLPGDTEMRFFMYISAHGMTLKAPTGTKDGYILPVDIKRPNGQDPEDDVVRSTGLRLSQFAEWAANAVRAKHALFVFDSCFSGAVLNPVMKGPPDKSEKPRPPGYALTDEAQRPLREFLAAGTEDQEVPASSYFLDVIGKALLGERREADSNHDGILTGTELITFVRESVSEQNSQQTPTSGRLNVHDMNRGEMAFVLPPLRSQKIGMTPPVPVASSAGKFKPVYRGVIDPGKGGGPQLVQFFQSEQYLTTDGTLCTTDCSKPGEARTYRLALDMPSDAPTNSTFDAPELSCIAGPCGQGFRLISGPTLASDRRHASVAFQSLAKQAIWRFSARVLTEASTGAVVVDRRDGSVHPVSDKAIAVSGASQDISPDYEQKLKPLLSDLQSDDQQNRHAGRKTLANVLSDAPPAVIAQLVRAMPVSTYRYQLGVAEALGHVEPGWRTTEASSTALLNSLRDKKNQDPTLKSSINKALLNQQFYVTDGSIQKDALNAANTPSTTGRTKQTIVKAGSDVELKAGVGDTSGIVAVAKKGSCLRFVDSKQYTASDGGVAVVRHPKC